MKKSVTDISMTSTRKMLTNLYAISCVGTNLGEKATASNIWRKLMAINTSDLNQTIREMVLRDRATRKIAR